MNRPLLIAAVGGVVVLFAIGLNFVLLQKDVAETPPEQQLATEVEAAAQAAEQARLESEKAELAAQKATEARAEAERAKSEAEKARLDLAKAEAARTAAEAAQTAAARAQETAAATEGSDKDAAVDAAQKAAQQARLEAEKAAAAAKEAAAVTSARENAAKSAQEIASRASVEAEEAKTTAQKAAKAAQAEAAAAREVTRQMTQSGSETTTPPSDAASPVVKSETVPEVRAPSTTIIPLRVPDEAKPTLDASDKTPPLPHSSVPQTSQPKAAATAASQPTMVGSAPETAQKPRPEANVPEKTANTVLAAVETPSASRPEEPKPAVVPDSTGKVASAPSSEPVAKKPQQPATDVAPETPFVSATPPATSPIAPPPPLQATDRQPAAPSSSMVSPQLPRATEKPVAEPSSAAVPAATPPVQVTSLPTSGSKADRSAAAPKSPSFDIVRIETDGSAVLAGRAEPKSTVVIESDTGEIGRTTANREGEWVYIPDEPLDPGNRELSLKSIVGDRELPSKSVVVIVVPDRAKPQVAAASTPSAPASQQGALALAVPREGKGASRVLQKVEPEKSDMALTVDSVDYDDSGNLTISGRAPEKQTVQVYLDNEFVGRNVADDEGRWALNPEPGVPTGLYTLRADLVDASGKVSARISFPFSRAEPIMKLAPGSFIVVQPGNSLWRIARRVYGEGIQYHEIYQANAEQIRDPDLIYPGQIFSMPQAN